MNQCYRDFLPKFLARMRLEEASDLNVSQAGADHDPAALSAGDDESARHVDQPDPLAELPGFDDADADAGAMESDIRDILDF